MLQHHLLELKHSDQIEMSVMYKNTRTKKRYAFDWYLHKQSFSTWYLYFQSNKRCYNNINDNDQIENNCTYRDWFGEKKNIYTDQAKHCYV